MRTNVKDVKREGLHVGQTFIPEDSEGKERRVVIVSISNRDMLVREISGAGYVKRNRWGLLVTLNDRTAGAVKKGRFISQEYAG